jgi:hypothetical protein
MTGVRTENARPGQMKRLLEKGGEFYLCAQHLHMRGMSDVIDECKPIVADLIASGKTFKDVQDYFEEAAGDPVDFEKDKFTSLIRDMFEQFTPDVGNQNG